MLVCFVSNVIRRYLFLSIYIWLFKNAVECVDFSWSNMMTNLADTLGGE